MPAKDFETMTREHYRNLADRLRQTVANLEALDAAMEALRFESIDVHSVGLMKRGMAGMENFVKYSWDCLNDAREEMGHFGPSAPEKNGKKSDKE